MNNMLPFLPLFIFNKPCLQFDENLVFGQCVGGYGNILYIGEEFIFVHLNLSSKFKPTLWMKGWVKVNLDFPCTHDANVWMSQNKLFRRNFKQMDFLYDFFQTFPLILRLVKTLVYWNLYSITHFILLKYILS